MTKLYRGIIKVIQKINYTFGKTKLKSMDEYDNILRFLKDRGVRLDGEFSKDLSRGIRINKQFPAGKTIDLEIKENIFELIVLYRSRHILGNMDNLGTSGIDIYFYEGEKLVWVTSIAPNNDYQMYVKKEVCLQPGTKRIRLYLPSFASLEGIYVMKSKLNQVLPQNIPDIVLYGSSITHGCAASRPGLSYANQLSTRLSCSVENYGFSESAKGEEKVIEYISKIPAKLLIMEYDHNASVEELKKTHLNTYTTARRYFQGWIILMTRFSGGLSITLEEEKERISIVESTYKYAISKGDNKISFIDGSTLLPSEKDKYFVDRVHPNDIGMNMIAEKLCFLIEQKGMLK